KSWQGIKFAADKTAQGIKTIGSMTASAASSSYDRLAGFTKETYLPATAKALSAAGSFLKDNAFIILSIAAIALILVGIKQFYSYSAPIVQRRLGDMNKNLRRRAAHAKRTMAREEMQRRLKEKTEKARKTVVSQVKEEVFDIKKALISIEKATQRKITKGAEGIKDTIVETEQGIQENITEGAKDLTKSLKKGISQGAKDFRKAVIREEESIRQDLAKGASVFRRSIKKRLKQETRDFKKAVIKKEQHFKSRIEKSRERRIKAKEKQEELKHETEIREHERKARELMRRERAKQAEVRGETARQAALRIKELERIQREKPTEQYRVELSRFIINSLKQRHTKEQIKEVLLKKGWPKKFVDDYCDKVIEIARLKAKGLKF
ncbi:hypothetical protein GOV06_02170, partial [Candidatus Woesearchaeota archaeon]|nr:hypothetical protein [Candidatus Woesearchaeota archaeon]